MRPGRFLLITGEDDEAWGAAADKLAAEHHLPIDTVRIGHLDGDYLDPRCRWLRLRGISASGALLVRPDRFIAWRHLDAGADPHVELATALGAVLGRDLSS